ncbi:MAG: hypothetical protein ABR584_01970 [Candidatus Baltobacteraceae bacterium]
MLPIGMPPGRATFLLSKKRSSADTANGGRYFVASTGLELFKERLRTIGVAYVDFKYNTLTIQASKRIPTTEYYKKLQDRIVQYINADPVVAQFFSGCSRIDIRQPEAPAAAAEAEK